MTLSQNDGLVGDGNGASRSDRNARAVGGHIIGHDGVDVLAILAPPGLRKAAVERLARRHALRRRGTIGCDDREMLHPVGAVLLLVAFEERDPFAVRAELRLAASAAAGRRRQRLLVRSGLRIGDEQLGGWFTVWIRIAVARERDARSVRRPGGRPLVGLAGRQPI